MCERGDSCQKPEQLKGEPKDCSPDQIKECHGSTKDHPCVAKNKGKPEDCPPSRSTNATAAPRTRADDEHPGRSASPEDPDATEQEPDAW
jgi:hypothetical protein